MPPLQKATLSRKKHDFTHSTTDGTINKKHLPIGIIPIGKPIGVGRVRVRAASRPYLIYGQHRRLDGPRQRRHHDELGLLLDSVGGGLQRRALLLPEVGQPRVQVLLRARRVRRRVESEAQVREKK